MNNRIFIRLIFCLALISLSCSKDVPMSSELAQSEQESVLGKPGATQISGIGFPSDFDECDDPPLGAVLATRMTGDLEGCLYTIIDKSECSPSGTYREQGREVFVGTYHGETDKTGTFETTYKFEAKYESCPEPNSPFPAEIFGRCQHPIVAGSGTDGFEGVTGRIDFKDEVDPPVQFPYRGHLRF